MRDRISMLPDSLIYHILSFLPIKEVIATSLLSKRWRPIRQSHPTLDFDDTNFPSLDMFLQFVDAIWILGDLKPIIEFHLKCRSRGVPPVRINIWINAVIRRKVEHLELCLSSYKFNLYLPSAVFNSGSIKVLKLSGEISVNTRSSFNLTPLKVLNLEMVRFPDLECAANLLSRCPRLENLVLKSLRMRNYSSTWDIERLKHLFSADVPPFLIKLKAFSNMELLKINTISWCPSHDIPIFSNLTRLEFYCCADNLSRIVKCLQNCPKLEILVIRQLYLIFSNPAGKEWLMEPVVDVPQCLYLHLKEFSLGEYRGLEREFEIARFIMKNGRVS